VDQIRLRENKNIFLACFMQETEPHFKKSERRFEKSEPIPTA
jgi:hypothetical protein